MSYRLVQVVALELLKIRAPNIACPPSHGAVQVHLPLYFSSFEGFLESAHGAKVVLFGLSHRNMHVFDTQFLKEFCFVEVDDGAVVHLGSPPQIDDGFHAF